MNTNRIVEGLLDEADSIAHTKSNIWVALKAIRDKGQSISRLAETLIADINNGNMEQEVKDLASYEAQLRKIQSEFDQVFTALGRAH